MTKKPEITQKDFERLLDWLDPDREAAAAKYQSLHRRLVQIFLARKAFPAEELADRTMDVVLQKIDYLTSEYQGDPRHYFYSVAYKIFQESLRKPKPAPLGEHLSDTQIEKEIPPRIECLRECLGELTPEKREIFIEYFQHEKRTKIESHKKMAENLGIDLKALRTRVYRIREKLEECILNCIGKKIV